MSELYVEKFFWVYLNPRRFQCYDTVLSRNNPQQDALKYSAPISRRLRAILDLYRIAHCFMLQKRIASAH